MNLKALYRLNVVANSKALCGIQVPNKNTDTQTNGRGLQIKIRFEVLLIRI